MNVFDKELLQCIVHCEMCQEPLCIFRYLLREIGIAAKRKVDDALLTVEMSIPEN